MPVVGLNAYGAPASASTGTSACADSGSASGARSDVARLGSPRGPRAASPNPERARANSACCSRSSAEKTRRGGLRRRGCAGLLHGRGGVRGATRGRVGPRCALERGTHGAAWSAARAMARPMCEKTANVGGLNGYARIAYSPKTKAVVFDLASPASPGFDRPWSSQFIKGQQTNLAILFFRPHGCVSLPQIAEPPRRAELWSRACRGWTTHGSLSSSSRSVVRACVMASRAALALAPPRSRRAAGFRARVGGRASLALVLVRLRVRVRVSPPPRPRRARAAVTRAGSGDGRHSRSKLREKEERRWDRENDRESASSSKGRQRDALVKMDDGAVTVDFKNAGAEVKSLGTKIKRAHKKAVRKLTKKVDAAVSGLTNGGNKPATFRANRTSAQPSGYYGRAGAGYAAPPPWLGGLLGWGALFAAAWAITKVFGLGGGVRNASGTFRCLRSGGGGGANARRDPGRGAGSPTARSAAAGVGRGQISGRAARERARRGPGVRRPAPLGGCHEGEGQGRGEGGEGGGGGERVGRAAVVVAAVAGVLPSRAARPSPASGQGAAGDAVLQARGRRRVHRRGHRGPEGRLRVRERVRGGVRRPPAPRRASTKPPWSLRSTRARRGAPRGRWGEPRTFLSGLSEDVGVKPVRPGGWSPRPWRRGCAVTCSRRRRRSARARTARRCSRWTAPSACCRRSPLGKRRRDGDGRRGSEAPAQRGRARVAQRDVPEHRGRERRERGGRGARRETAAMTRAWEGRRACVVPVRFFTN